MPLSKKDALACHTQSMSKVLEKVDEKLKMYDGRNAVCFYRQELEVPPTTDIVAYLRAVYQTEEMGWKISVESGRQDDPEVIKFR